MHTGKIKVAFILSGLGYMSRGTEVAFTSYVRELAKKDDLEIIVFGAGKHFALDGVRYVRVPSLMRHFFKHFPKIKRLHLGRDHGWEEALFAILVAPVMLFYRIDVVVHSSFPFNLWPIRVYRTLRNGHVKSVFNSGGGTGFSYSRHFFADAVTATDPYSQAFFAARGFNTILIPPGVDMTLIQQKESSRAALGVPKDKLLIFSSSALDPIKRIDFLIRAAGKMRDVFVMLSNNGTEREHLEMLGKEILGENIQFLGAVDRDTLMQCYAAADVFCLPSKTEPFGLVLIEAMASSTPVVTNNTDIQQWIVKDGGSCINVEDEATLISALESYRDVAHREKVGVLAKKNAERFSWGLAANQYHQLFYELTTR
jgi:glycosyltransferase involved in cell wall biosynthesis